MITNILNNSRKNQWIKFIHYWFIRSASWTFSQNLLLRSLVFCSIIKYSFDFLANEKILCSSFVGLFVLSRMLIIYLSQTFCRNKLKLCGNFFYASRFGEEWKMLAKENFSFSVLLERTEAPDEFCESELFQNTHLCFIPFTLHASLFVHVGDLWVKQIGNTKFPLLRFPSAVIHCYWKLHFISTQCALADYFLSFRFK